MSGSKFAHCPGCSRLLLVGQRCMCSPRPDSRCDCTHDGNEEHQGDTCRARERATWAAVVNRKWTAKTEGDA